MQPYGVLLLSQCFYFGLLHLDHRSNNNHMSASSSSSSSYAATAASASAGAGVSNQPAEHESVSVDSAGGPWEWPSFAMWIRQMEESMLCPICGRFIEAAVTIRQCGHVFCSECIRRHRAHDEDQVCPACRGGHRTGIDIVATPSINRMIDSWLSTRQVGDVWTTAVALDEPAIIVPFRLSSC